jgi:hypothetical protein
MKIAKKYEDATGAFGHSAQHRASYSRWPRKTKDSTGGQSLTNRSSLGLLLTAIGLCGVPSLPHDA